MTNMWHVGTGPQAGAETDTHFATTELTRELCALIRGEIEPLIEAELKLRDVHRDQARYYKQTGTEPAELSAWRLADEAQTRVTGMGEAFDEFDPARADVGTFRNNDADFRAHVEQLIADRMPLPAGPDFYVYAWRCEVDDCPHCEVYRKRYEDEEE